MHLHCLCTATRRYDFLSTHHLSFEYQVLVDGSDAFQKTWLQLVVPPVLARSCATAFLPVSLADLGE